MAATSAQACMLFTLREPPDAGFFIRRFFATDEPLIDAKRVAMGAMAGGHDVPMPRIIARYTRPLAGCSLVAPVADRT